MSEDATQNQLIDAARAGDTGRVQALLDAGADPDGRDDAEGQTALMHAARGAHLEPVKLLMERGASLDIRSLAGSSVLGMAVVGGSVDVVRLLLEHGVDVNAPGVKEQFPLQIAVIKVDV